MNAEAKAIEKDTGTELATTEGGGMLALIERKAYRMALKHAHPDHGGSSVAFIQVKQAGRALGL